MKKIIAATALAICSAAAASATTFSVNVEAFPYRAPGQPGLQTRAHVLSLSGPQNFEGATYNFDLNPGDSVDVDLYRIAAYDAPLDVDDLIFSPSNAVLELVGNATRTVLGQSYGRAATQDALLTFANSFGYNVGGGYMLIATINDTVFGNNGVSFVNGAAGAGVVTATFTLAPVPVPAALPLAATGLGFLGLFGRRRKKAQKA